MVIEKSMRISWPCCLCFIFPLPTVLAEGVLPMVRSSGCGQDARNERAQTLGGSFSLSLNLCFLGNIKTDMNEADFVMCQLKVWRTDDDGETSHMIRLLAFLGGSDSTSVV